MPTNPDEKERAVIAEAVKCACRRAAAEGYEDALIRGLCAEGAFEAAMGAIDTIDVNRLISASKRGAPKRSAKRSPRDRAKRDKSLTRSKRTR